MLGLGTLAFRPLWTMDLGDGDIARVAIRSVSVYSSPEVSLSDKRIEISIALQTLTAYEKDQVVFQTKVSTGVPDRRDSPGLVPTNTPSGVMAVPLDNTGNETRNMGANRIRDETR